MSIFAGMSILPYDLDFRSTFLKLKITLEHFMLLDLSVGTKPFTLTLDLFFLVDSNQNL